MWGEGESYKIKIRVWPLESSRKEYPKVARGELSLFIERFMLRGGIVR